ncbi:MAG: uroporphyrinogen decarboxylase family protein [Candidatus Latescibacteria bacterium]|nr:uroporphyrinogen decarboxylase family protein [Candidatus Latescibacterota bacterium]
MAYVNIMDDLKKCIDLGIPGRVPCFPLGLDFDIRDAGFTHRRFRTDPEVMVQVGLNAIEKYDYDWFILHPDDLIEYEDMGITVKTDENIPPAVVKYLPATESTFANLKLPAEPEKNPRMALHLEGLRGLKKELGGEICLTGRMAAPFSSVSLVLGVEATLFLMLENPKLLMKFMDFFVEYNDAYAQAQLEAGADAIWLGDCVATSHFISPKHYKDFAAEYADTSSKLIQERGGIVFYHGCETSIPHLEIMAQLSFNAINIGEGIDIMVVKKAIGKTKCIMGNLDTINVLQQKSPEEVEEETRTIVEKGKVDGGYIFCTGEGIPYNTPKENVKSMVKTVRVYGKC